MGRATEKIFHTDTEVVKLVDCMDLLSLSSSELAESYDQRAEASNLKEHTTIRDIKLKC